MKKVNRTISWNGWRSIVLLVGMMAASYAVGAELLSIPVIALFVFAVIAITVKIDYEEEDDETSS